MNNLKGLKINLNQHDFLEFTNDEYEIYEINDVNLKRLTKSDYIYVYYVYGVWYVSFSEYNDLTVDTIIHHESIKIERENHKSSIIKII